MNKIFALLFSLIIKIYLLVIASHPPTTFMTSLSNFHFADDSTRHLSTQFKSTFFFNLYLKLISIFKFSFNCAWAEWDFKVECPQHKEFSPQILYFSLLDISSIFGISFYGFQSHPLKTTVLILNIRNMLLWKLISH